MPSFIPKNTVPRIRVNEASPTPDPAHPLERLAAIEATRQASRRPEQECFVIEGPKGDMLPACRAEIRFSDPESAASFLEIFQRLGHSFPGFAIRERAARR